MQNRLVSILGSLYISTLLYTQVPFVQKLTLVKGADQLFWNHIAIFMIFFVPTFFILSKYIYAEESYGLWQYIKLLLLFLSILGLVITLLYHIIPVDSIYTFPVFLDQFFLSDMYQTIWFIAPLVIMLF